MILIIVAIMYVIAGAVAGALYHGFKEVNDHKYDFEDEGGLTVAFAIFWPIATIIFVTYHTYMYYNKPK